MLCFRLPGLESPVDSWNGTQRLQLRAQLRIGRVVSKATPHSHLSDVAAGEPERRHHRGVIGDVNPRAHSHLEAFKVWLGASFKNDGREPIRSGQIRKSSSVY